ncbi:MAG: hypothetical protein ABSG95_09585 [Solirubrobacteraceae bacterium]
MRIRRGRLDRELAEGCVCDASEARALRARQLADLVTRGQLARSLREVVAQAENPRAGVLSSTVPVVRRVVVAWREALLGLAERLEQAGPINPGGVARVLDLLSDGTGPLYNPAPRRSIEEAIWWVADGLYLCPPHDWQCPVRTELDPDHLVWTCSRCGAIATTDDLAVGPE